MPDTKRGDFNACSDCGENGAYLKHWGLLVPEGEVGYFDEKCFQTRREDRIKGLPPRPLGQRKKAL